MPINFSYSEAIASNKALLESVKRAHELLAGVIGKTSRQVTEDWSLETAAKGLPRVELTLTDQETQEQISRRFSPEELNDGPSLLSRLDWLWGDLLKNVSHKLLEQMRS